MLDLVQQENKQRICLCMIVKDEEAVIERAFDSVRDVVDCYVICDTGSTDNTVETIQAYWKKHKLEGTVYERPWVNFSHNRQEAFDYAKGKCDYILTLDADEVIAPYKNGEALLTSKVTILPELRTDIVYLTTAFGNCRYLRGGFYNEALSWKWHQPIHEYCHSHTGQTESILPDLCTFVTQEGARSKDPQKYLRDAIVFENWLLDNPEDGRAMFYLAQSYGDAGEYEKALSACERALVFTEWHEELYMLWVRKARWKRLLGNPFSDSVHDYLKAFNTIPYRSEAVCDLLQGFLDENDFNTMVMIGEKALEASAPPPQALFSEKESYEWKIKDHMSVAYYNTGRLEESKQLMEDLISENKAPSGEMDRIKSNYEQFKD